MDPLTIVMLGVLALLIFFMFRNSRKRRADMENLQSKMVPGAEVMTNFGLFGTLIDLDEDNNVATIEVAPGSTVRVHRQTLARVVEDEVVDEEPVEDDALQTEAGADAPTQAPRLNESSADSETKKSDD